MDNKEIIIIGGGMAGITLALFLKKAGMDPSIFESHPENKKSGVAFTIAPNGMHVMDQLGLAEIIKANGNIVKAFEFRGEKGDHIARMRTGPIGKYGQPPVMIERYLMQEILNQAAKAVGVRINYQKKLTSFYNKHDRITAVFEDNSTVEGAILVGADGINSITRRLLFPKAQGKSYKGFHGIGGLVKLSDIPGSNALPKNQIDLVYGKNGFFGYGFDKADEMLWWANLEMPENEIQPFIAKSAKDHLRRYLFKNFECYAFPVSELINATETYTQTPGYEIKNFQNWHMGRVVLIGDADMR